MSSTRGNVKKNCAYFTRPRVADALISVLDIAPGSLILEPHVGQGEFVRALVARGHKTVHANDVDIALVHNACSVGAAVTTCVDFLRFRTDLLFDWITGNPPYSKDSDPPRYNKKGSIIQEPCAEQHARHAISLLGPGGHLAFLLRMGFLATAERIPFWQEFPAKIVWQLMERPPFDETDSTDSCEYGWFLWEKGWRPERPDCIVGEVRSLSWKEHSDGRADTSGNRIHRGRNALACAGGCISGQPAGASIQDVW